MSNPNPSMITFTPAASVTITPPPLAPATFALPAYDASNLDLLLTSNSGSRITLSFSGGGAIIPPYAQILLTANAATLVGNVNPLAQSMGALGPAATTCTATQDQNIGSLTITRGTAVVKPVF